MIIASLQVNNTLEKIRFFQGTFQIVDIKIDIVFKMSFLIVTNANIQFREIDLIWRTYITANALLTTEKVQIIDWKNFTKAILDPN